MANRYQSTKTGRQIDASIDYTEKLPNIIETINKNIENLNNNKANINIIPRTTEDLIDNSTENTYNSTSTKPQSGKAVSQAIANLLGSAPENLDTLEELAKALNEDENFSATVLAEIAKKVDKEEGKGLSTNDFTNVLKAKVENNTFDYYIEPTEYEENFDYDSYTGQGIYLLHKDNVSDDEIRPYYILTVTYYYDYGCGYESGNIPRVTVQTRLNLINGETERRDDSSGRWSAWQKVSVSQTDLDKAIGDIEASLENIIKKYGLGGDDV